MAGNNALQDTGKSVRQALYIGMFVLGLLAASLCVLASVHFARNAMPWLDAAHGTIGELALREGERLEEAGAYEAAFTKYEAALSCRFEGPQNRAKTLYHLGMLQKEQGLGAGGPDYLQEACAHPNAPAEALAACAVGAMSGYVAEREAALRELFGRWELSVNSDEERAKFYFYLGGFAQLRGETEEAKALWMRGEGYVRGSACAYALAEVLYGEDALALAREYNNLYLLHGRDKEFLAQAAALSGKMGV